MGYAVIMFGVLLVMSVVMVAAVNYGIAKDSLVAPLKAENVYAERETGKAQTGLTINNTCLTADTSSDRYTKASGGKEPISGPYTLHLTVNNNGSTVLNPNNATVIYNTTNFDFGLYNWAKKLTDNEFCEEGLQPNNIKVWPPMTYVCMKVHNIIIPTPDLPAPGPDIRLMMTAENGVATIAPTTPTNFTGYRNDLNSSYIFNWNASYDEDGISNYLLYSIDAGERGACPPDLAGTVGIITIPGNATSSSYDYVFYCDGCGGVQYFYLKAVDKLGNQGVQSRTLKCKKTSGEACTFE